jgi:membrane fusion protein (multidrug efflux system)
MIKRMIVMLLLVALVFGLVFGWKFYMGMQMQKAMMAMGMPAQTVSTIKAEPQDWQPKLEGVGSVRAVNGADLSFEVSGTVEKLYFDSGSNVEEGAILAQLRADDDIARMKTLQAAEELADINYQRDMKQIKTQAISQATADADQAALQEAKAELAQQQAIVDKKTLRAPFSGHLGIRMADLGQYLNPGTLVVTLQQIDPLYVDFNLPEQAMTQLATGQKAYAVVDAFGDKPFEGEISAINSKVDQATRNILVRAEIKNPDHKLLPGMFAHINIEVGSPQKYITVPQTAITYNPYGDTVYIVDGDADKPTAKQVFVKEGSTRGDQVAILSGIKEGDQVVTAGQIKLRNGMPVKINNDVQPSNDPNPKPHDQ